MIIRTSTLIPSTPELIWPLLTHSSMDIPGCFCLGLPKPISCELSDSTGGLGTERRCISDRGVVHQRITAWQPPHYLQFIMVSTNHRWSTQVESIQEEFQIHPHHRGVKLTRTTTLKASPPFRLIKEIGFYLGLKRIHWYVFKNWRASTTTRTHHKMAQS